MPKAQNEEYRSALGIMLSVTHNDQRAHYLIEYAPVDDKTNFNTVEIVQNALERFQITSMMLKENLVPVIGDCAIRGALKVSY